MMMEGMDGRLLVVSSCNPRYALHSATLRDGAIVSIKEDLQQTREFKEMAVAMRDRYVSAPRFYITGVRLPSGETVNPKNVLLPDVLRLNDGTIVRQYVIYAPDYN